MARATIERRETTGSLSRKRAGVAVRPLRGNRGRWRLWLRRGAWAVLALIVLGTSGLAGVFWYYGRDLPPVSQLRHYSPPEVTHVVDRNGLPVDDLYVERRTVVPMARVPRVLVLAVLAAEDADFYRHEGLDYPGIVRALVRHVVTGRRIQGTSTITQQIVKNLLLSPERSFGRKIKELILARRLEQEYTKDEILGLYLNTINYGHGRYGVQEAARYYFGKDVSELDLAEATLIAGVPQSPTHLSPRDHPEAARRRQGFVLDQLAAKRGEYWPDLSAADIAAARTETVRLTPLADASETAPEVIDHVRRLLDSLVGHDAAAHGGYTVHTTIDMELERAARDALRKGLVDYDRRHAARPPFHVVQRVRGQPVPRPPPRVAELRLGHPYDAVVTGTDDAANTLELDVGGHRALINLGREARYNPESLPPSRFADRGARLHVSILRAADANEANAAAEARLELGPEGAIVAIDPATRDVLALVGGYERVPGFDRALDAVRQPGSTFKPVVYGLAIATRRYTPATIVLDAPVVYDRWQPQNFETWHYQGAIRMREALAQSINLVAVRVMEDVQPSEVVTFARALGITTALDPTLALALGASDVKPVELVNAYATIAAGGHYAPYRLVTRIEGPGGHDVAIPVPPGQEHDAMAPASAYVLTSMMESVVDHGTAAAARRIARPLAGKTGTSNEARDAWFVGFTPDVVAGIWVGFDDRRSLGRRESGARTALPIWMDLATTLFADRPVVDFPIPEGVVHAQIDPVSGLLAYEGEAGALDEVFLDGTVPTETATPAGIADPNTYLMEQMGAPVTPAPAQ